MTLSFYPMYYTKLFSQKRNKLRPSCTVSCKNIEISYERSDSLLVRESLVQSCLWSTFLLVERSSGEHDLLDRRLRRRIVPSLLIGRQPPSHRPAPTPTKDDSELAVGPPRPPTTRRPHRDRHVGTEASALQDGQERQQEHQQTTGEEPSGDAGLGARFLSRSLLGKCPLGVFSLTTVWCIPGDSLTSNPLTNFARKLWSSENNSATNAVHF